MFGKISLTAVFMVASTEAIKLDTEAHNASKLFVDIESQEECWEGCRRATISTHCGSWAVGCQPGVCQDWCGEDDGFWKLSCAYTSGCPVPTF